MADISANIRKLRVQRGMNQAALAEKLGVTRQTVSSWERGASFPDIQTVGRLSETFGVRVDELLYPQPAERKRRALAEPISGKFVPLSMLVYGLLLLLVWRIRGNAASLVFWGLLLLFGFIALCTCLLSEALAAPERPRPEEDDDEK
jgi:transcriptional regulator with XRE-family HTH domain